MRGGHTAVRRTASMKLRQFLIVVALAATAAIALSLAPELMADSGNMPETAENADADGEQATVPLPGDPAPPLVIREWLQRGVYDEVRPADGRLITVIEFWASWDPLSRAVLPMHDELQAELADRGVRLLAASPEAPEDVRAYLAQSGLRNIAIACDDNETTLRAFFPSDRSVHIPFTILLEERSPSGDPCVLWRGPAVTHEDAPAWDDGYTVPFEDGLADILADRLDASAARDAEIARSTLLELRHSVGRGWVQKDFDQVASVGREVLSADWPSACAPTYVGTCGTAAWVLTTEGAPTDHIALALTLARAALDAADDEAPPLLHVYARCLFLNGAVEQAVTVQRRAAANPEPSGVITEESYAEALAEYERALAEKLGEAPPAHDEVTKSAPTGDVDEAPESPPDEVQDEPPSPPKSLSAEQAVQDLLALHDHLRLNYVAYDDTTWDLAGRGSSWEEYNAGFVRRINARERWALPEFLELVSDYFHVFQDCHPSIRAVLPSEDGPRTEWVHPNRGVVPFFADVTVCERQGRMVFVDPPDEHSRLEGASAVDVPVIGSPLAARAGQAYLFPTLAREPRAATPHVSNEHLLGVLAKEVDALRSVTIAVRADPNDEPAGDHEVSLPLHRGRVAFHRREGDPLWALSEDPLPVVAVRRMWGDEVEDMPKSAAEVRECPAVVLDLRANQGGSDHYGWEWCRHFTDQNLRAFSGFANVHPGEVDPLLRWDSRLLAALDNPYASVPSYSGRLFVLTDTGAGSSGETFTSLAGQIEGAIVVGENTAGCCTYGNMDQHFDLPHSQFHVSFTRSKSVSGHRGSREGFGFFPDYWLDTDDPVAAIVEFCKRNGWPIECGG
jgi:hypothetical protein